MYRFYNPVRTYLGAGCFSSIHTIIEEAVGIPKSAVLLVWNESVLELDAVKTYLGSVDYAIKTVVFDKANPTVENLYDLYCQMRTVSYDLVLAIGGGSVLDAAKILTCMREMTLETVEDVRTMLHDKTIEAPTCRWIGVPTTAGTGSEVTCWATIWDVEKGKKLSVDREDNYAAAAVVDATFTKTMPLALAVSSALDAVAHATESYWAKDRNPVTKALALSAIQTILAHVDALIEQEEAEKAQDAMATGSMIAGLAFSNTHTTACHSISYPLTMYYNIPHGVAVSMLIAPMIAVNCDYMEHSDALLSAFGVNTVGELQERISSILQRANIKAGLRDWGVQESELQEITNNAFTKGRIDNNPVALTKEDVYAVLHNIL